MTGAVTCTEIHWGVRYTSSIGGSHITDYETDEDDARRAFKQAVQPGGRQELLRRTVRIGEWEPVDSKGPPRPGPRGSTERGGG